MVGAADLAPGAVDLAAGAGVAGAAAAGLAAVAGLAGGLVAVWADATPAAKVVRTPAVTTRTRSFMDANLSGSPLYCNQRRSP